MINGAAARLAIQHTVHPIPTSGRSLSSQIQEFAQTEHPTIVGQNFLVTLAVPRRWLAV